MTEILHDETNGKEAKPPFLGNRQSRNWIEIRSIFVYVYEENSIKFDKNLLKFKAGRNYQYGVDRPILYSYKI